MYVACRSDGLARESPATTIVTSVDRDIFCAWVPWLWLKVDVAEVGPVVM